MAYGGKESDSFLFSKTPISLSFFLSPTLPSFTANKTGKGIWSFHFDAFSVDLVSHSKGKVRGKIMARVMGCHTRQDRLAYIQSEVG